MNRKSGCRRRDRPGSPSAQYSSAGLAPARAPQVRSKMSFIMSMAMSQRTPSHCPAISESVSIAACRRPGWKALSCRTSGQAGKYGSRPQAKTFPSSLDEGRRIAPQVVRASLDEVLGMLADPGVVGRDVVGHEVEDQPHAARGERAGGPRPAPSGRRGARRRRSGARSRASRRCPRPRSRAAPAGSPSRSPGFRMEIAMPAGLRSQTPMSQTASKPRAAMASHSCAGTVRQVHGPPVLPAQLVAARPTC